MAAATFLEMDVENLKRCLDDGEREELGVPYFIDSLETSFPKILDWARSGVPQRPHQVWFTLANAAEIRDQLHPFLRARVLPVEPERLDLWMRRHPFDALLFPADKDPNLDLRPFWKSRGAYEICPSFLHDEVKLWFWRSAAKPLKLFGLDHHHAVLWDAKQILRPLGVRLDFTWLCDGRPPVNEALPSQEPPFQSSLDLYKTDPGKPLDPEFRQRILERGYQGIISSHSLVTTFRLRDLGLPMIHINSTRFGNEWIQDPVKHRLLVSEIRKLFQANRLKVVHNNLGDQGYFRQYFQGLEPRQEVVCPSLCESIARIRARSPKAANYLVWDTRQVLLQDKGSPFMKQMFSALRGMFGNQVESQALLLAKAQSYLPEGYLDKYTAVIHLPYNVSTMSIFQQTAANIPVWVPSPALLKKLWMDAAEPNELSWTVFEPGSESAASPLDQVRKEEVVDWWVKRADFYEGRLPLVFQFDSIEDLVQRLGATDYNQAIQAAEEKAADRREEIFATWEQVLQGIR